MQDDERAIRELVARWQAATSAGDVDAVLALMTDDAVFLVPGREPMDKAAFAAAMRPAGAAQGAAPPVDASSEIREIRVAGEWAFMWTALRVSVTPPAGAPVERAGHTLTVLRKVDGAWRLARDANLLAPVSPPA